MRPNRVVRRSVAVRLAKKAGLTLRALQGQPPAAPANVQGGKALYAVMEAADELLACPDVDTIYRRAVELARDRLGLERCGIWLLGPGGEHFRGTYGTGLNGQTTDERECAFGVQGHWMEGLELCGQVDRRWLLHEGTGLSEYRDGRPLEVGRGWVACTPIHSAAGAVGVMFNDAAASGAPPDESRQELVAVYCSLLGTIISRRQAELEKQATEARLERVLDSLDDGVWSASLEDWQLYMSRSAEEICGHTAEAFIRRGDLWLEIIHPEDRERVSLLAVRVPNAGSIDTEFRLVRPDGEVRWVRVRGQLAYGPSGDIARIDGTLMDVTQRKRAQESLEFVLTHARCLLWSALVDAPARPGGPFRWSAGHLDVEAAQRFLPLDLRPGESYSDALYRNVPPEDQRRINQDARRAFENGRSGYDHEFRVRRRDGEVRWLYEQVQIEPLGEGRWGATSVCTDVTERKRAEESLRYITAQARCILWYANVRQHENADGESWLDWELSVPDEEAAQRFLPLERSPGQGYADAWWLSRLPEDRERSDRIGSSAILDGLPGYTQEFRCVDANGALRWLHEDVVVESTAPGCWRLVGVCSDVTKEKQAEERLRKSEQRFRSLIEGSSDVISIVDADGKIVYESPSVQRVLGYAPDELIGADAFGLVHPEDAEPMRAEFGATLGGKPLPGLSEFRFRHADGTWRTLEATGKRFGDEPDRPTILVNSRDITDRKNLEAQLRQSQKMEAIGQLAGGVAHDFNNMLAVINGYSELLLMTGKLDTPASGYVEEIHKAGERAAGLTRQLLAFSRKQMMQQRVLDLNQIAAGMETMLRRLIGEDIDLLTLFDPALRPVRADAGQIEQAILNLAVNARDAMPQGGRLTLATRNLEADAAFHRAHPEVRPGRYVVLEVRDSGCGMDSRTLSHIFEPFFTTKEPGKGTGLGLATVYGIVAANGGCITTESAPGQGTTFRVYLPVAPEAEPAAEALPEAAPVAGQETVLLTEDDPSVRGLVSAILKGAGYRVLEADRPTEALRLAREHPAPIDLLLTDVVMPGLSGRQLVEQLLPLRPSIKVLYMSGYTDDAIVRHGVQEEGTVLLQKPFTAAALTRTLRELLDA